MNQELKRVAAGTHGTDRNSNWALLSGFSSVAEKRVPVFQKRRMV